MFDLDGLLSELRRRPTGWISARRDEVVREQRRLHVEELALTRILDERGALDESMPARDGVSERAVRETIETARALESLPQIAAAAHAGRLSDEQLGAVVRLADEASDAEWAWRAPNTTPEDLARTARTMHKPSTEDARRRREARHLRMWWSKDRGMLGFRGELPDVAGARFEKTIQDMVEQMKPPKGQRWDSWEHRAADALVTLVDEHNALPADAPATLAAPSLLVTEVPEHGPATIAGIALPDSMVESLRAMAQVEPVLVTQARDALARGTRRATLSAKIRRAVLLRDGHCRGPGCHRRHGLHIHHIVPVSEGGTDDIANLVAVCPFHHGMLIPSGPWAPVGNPNVPDGLRLVRTSRARDGPAA